jgi:hypothetical protein
MKEMVLKLVSFAGRTIDQKTNDPKKGRRIPEQKKLQ